MPIRMLQNMGYAVTGYFDNPNIHPLAEYLRRREGAAQVAAAAGIPLLFAPADAEYGVEAWCRAALGYPAGRCVYCRESRFSRTAAFARAQGFTAFSSSLLYSRHQDHQGMIQAGEAAAAASGVSFIYNDFRSAWQEGITASKALQIYRQQYCGCVFSEQERYARELSRAQQ